MSAASLLSTYAGVNPAVLVVDGANGGGPGATPTLAAVLAAGAAGANIAITALGDLTFGTGDTITGPAAARLDITSGAGQGVKVEGLNGASLVATTGGCKVEASAGILELNFDGVGGQLNVVPLAAAFTNAASAAPANGPTYAAANLKQLQIQIAGVNYWIALNPAAFA